MPKRDVNKHAKAYKRLVGLVCITDVTYMFLAVMFWQRTSTHPLYCGLCERLNLGAWIGFVIDMHCAFVILWGVNLIYAFVTRRYYLLALGGF